MGNLLRAPLQPLEQPGTKKARGRPVSVAVCYRDVAVLETIYSCGLRISELCGLTAGSIDWEEAIVRVRGKGKKERMLPIGAPALDAIRAYWGLLRQPPQGSDPVFQAGGEVIQPLSPRTFQSRLKQHLAVAGLDRPSHRTSCDTVMPPICWMPARICGVCRNCWATRTW